MCSTCTHCIAICPTQALSWNGQAPKAINPSLLPSNDQFKEFLKARRSDFHYKKKKIDRSILEDIATMGKYSPTNNYQIDVIIVDREETIRKLEAICIRGIERIHAKFFRPKLVRQIISRLSPEVDQAEVKIKAAIRSKHIFHQAPVLIIAIADPRVQLTELSVQYFLYNIQLYARTLGIGSRVSGGGKRFLARSKTAHKSLGIPDHQKIQGILTMGYPNFTYLNKVEGIRPNITFK